MSRSSGFTYYPRMPRWNWMEREFGSHRGLVRTVLADAMWYLGPFRKYRRVDWERVRRLVFVCRGNVCRSPFAHVLAADSVTTLPVASFGLAAGSGHPATPLAAEVARDFGVDLSAHRTTGLADFVIRDGDLFLAMEDRQLAQLRPHVVGRDVQVALLGLWCRPPFPLLYDPLTLPRDYYVTCFNRIQRAVHALAAEVEAAKNGAGSKDSRP